MVSGRSGVFYGCGGRNGGAISGENCKVVLVFVTVTKIMDSRTKCYREREDISIAIVPFFPDIF